MDATYFRRTPHRLWAWVLIPPLLALCTYVLAHGNLRRSRVQLKEAQDYAAVVPLAVRKLRDVEQVRERIPYPEIQPGQPGSAEILSTQIAGEARTHGLEIEFIGSQWEQPPKKAPTGEPPPPTVLVELRGTASLLSLVELLNDTQQAYPLVVLRNLQMQLLNLEGEPRYDVKLLLAYPVLNLEAIPLPGVKS